MPQFSSSSNNYTQPSGVHNSNSSQPAKKLRMKMLNMNKINGPANTSFYYPQSTRNPSGKHGNNNTSSSLLTGSNGNMSHTLKNAISGKGLFSSS